MQNVLLTFEGWYPLWIAPYEPLSGFEWKKRMKNVYSFFLSRSYY